jgi:hypothetical protein
MVVLQLQRSPLWRGLRNGEEYGLRRYDHAPFGSQVSILRKSRKLYGCWPAQTGLIATGSSKSKNKSKGSTIATVTTTVGAKEMRTPVTVKLLLPPWRS